MKQIFRTIHFDVYLSRFEDVLQKFRIPKWKSNDIFEKAYRYTKSSQRERIDSGVGKRKANICGNFMRRGIHTRICLVGNLHLLRNVFAVYSDNSEGKIDTAKKQQESREHWEASSSPEWIILLENNSRKSTLSGPLAFNVYTE